jgi:hypothetical protein
VLAVVVEVAIQVKLIILVRLAVPVGAVTEVPVAQAILLPQMDLMEQLTQEVAVEEADCAQGMNILGRWLHMAAMVVLGWLLLEPHELQLQLLVLLQLPQ